MNNLDCNMKIIEIYNELYKKYELPNCNIIFFCNSRKLDENRSIKDNKLENGDLIVLLEYNFH